ncbi:MAG: hypothetical protein JKY54_13710 [Flavobacteriales bacterium]|nr:hypothetical protein [Flavobacteriales bacterium]
MTRILVGLTTWAAIAGCSDKKQDSDWLQQLAGEQQEFATPSPSNKIAFPQDHAPHKNYRQEWWYLTANLEAESGEKFATQWTLFRVGKDKRHWYFAHAALADTRRHLSAFRDGREAMGNVRVETQPFSATIDDWSWLSTADFLPANLSYGSHSSLAVGQKLSQEQTKKQGIKPWRVDLKLTGPGHFYLQGDKGFSKKHPQLDIASHYYSQPFIDVSGSILWQGQRLRVSGSAWFDREWGSQVLAPDQQGWDWFSLRLDKDTALMVYRIRSDRQDMLYGSLMHRDGRIETLTAQQIKLTVALDKKDADDVYPQEFIIEIIHKAIDLNIKLVNKDQTMRFGFEYFEGMVSFDGSHQGVGFVEMTGYRR